MAERLDERHPGRDGPDTVDGEVLGPYTDQVVAGLEQAGREHVHRRGAEELRDEDVRRPVVHLLRRSHLLQHALVEHGDARAIVIASIWSWVT